MQLHEFLAITSLSGARMGILGIAIILLYYIGITLMINLIDRGEYSTDSFESFVVIATSFFSSTIGLVIGYGTSGKDPTTTIVYALCFCAVATFITSGKFLWFRFPHRLILSFSAPAILVFATWAGTTIELFIKKSIF